MNTRIRYQYRDAANYKSPGSVIVSGSISFDQVLRLQAALDGGRHFIAHQLGLPECFPWRDGAVDEELDHCFHEFCCVELVMDRPTDGRTVVELVTAFERIGPSGWEAFDPVESLGELA